MMAALLSGDFATIHFAAAIYRGRVLEEGNHEHLMQLNGYYAYLVAASST